MSESKKCLICGKPFGHAMYTVESKCHECSVSDKFRIRSGQRFGKSIEAQFQAMRTYLKDHFGKDIEIKIIENEKEVKKLSQNVIDLNKENNKLRSTIKEYREYGIVHLLEMERIENKRLREALQHSMSYMSESARAEVSTILNGES